MEKFPRNSLKDVAINNTKEIIENTQLYAKSVVYMGIKEKDKPSENYISSSFKLTQKLLATAGYRLTDKLKDLLKSVNFD